MWIISRRELVPDAIGIELEVCDQAVALGRRLGLAQRVRLIVRYESYSVSSFPLSSLHFALEGKLQYLPLQTNF